MSKKKPHRRFIRRIIVYTPQYYDSSLAFKSSRPARISPPKIKNGILKVERLTGAFGTSSVVGPIRMAYRGADHQAQNGVDRLGTVAFQTYFYKFYNRNNSCDNTQAEDDHHGQITEIKMEQLP